MKKSKRIIEDVTPNSLDFRWSITDSSTCSTLQFNNTNNIPSSRVKLRGRPKKVRGKAIKNDFMKNCPEEKRLEMSMISMDMCNKIVTRAMVTGRVGGTIKNMKKNAMLHQKKIVKMNLDNDDDSFNLDLECSAVVGSDRSTKINEVMMCKEVAPFKVGLNAPSQANRLSQCVNVSPLVNNSTVYECDIGGRKSFICVPISKDVERISLVMASHADDNARQLRPRNTCDKSQSSLLKRPLVKRGPMLKRIFKHSASTKSSRSHGQNMSDMSSLISLSLTNNATGCSVVDNLSSSTITDCPDNLSSPLSHQYEVYNITPSTELQIDRDSEVLKSPSLALGGGPPECSKEATFYNSVKEQENSSVRLSRSDSVTNVTFTARVKDEEEILVGPESSDNVENGDYTCKISHPDADNDINTDSSLTVSVSVLKLSSSSTLPNINSPEHVEDRIETFYVVHGNSKEEILSEECNSDLNPSADVPFTGESRPGQLMSVSGSMRLDCFRTEDESIRGPCGPIVAEDANNMGHTMPESLVDVCSRSLAPTEASLTPFWPANLTATIAKCTSKIPILRKDVSMMPQYPLPSLTLERTPIDLCRPRVLDGATSDGNGSVTSTGHIDETVNESLEVVAVESRLMSSMVPVDVSTMCHAVSCQSLTKETYVSSDRPVEDVDGSILTAACMDDEMSLWSHSVSPMSARQEHASPNYRIHDKIAAVSLQSASGTRPCHSSNAGRVLSDSLFVVRGTRQEEDTDSTPVPVSYQNESSSATVQMEADLSMPVQHRPSMTSSVSNVHVRYYLRRNKDGDSETHDCVDASHSTTSGRVPTPSVHAVLSNDTVCTRADLVVPDQGVSTKENSGTVTTTVSVRYNLRSRAAMSSPGSLHAVTVQSRGQDKECTGGHSTSNYARQYLVNSISQSMYHALATDIGVTEQISHARRDSEVAEVPFLHSSVPQSEISHRELSVDSPSCIGRRPEEHSQSNVDSISAIIPYPDSAYIESNKSETTVADVAVAKTIHRVPDTALSTSIARPRPITRSTSSTAVHCPSSSTTRQYSTSRRLCPDTSTSLARLVDSQYLSKSYMPSKSNCGPRLSPAGHPGHLSPRTTPLAKSQHESSRESSSGNKSYFESTRMMNVLKQLNISLSPIGTTNAAVSMCGEEMGTSDDDGDEDVTDDDCLSEVEEGDEDVTDDDCLSEVEEGDEDVTDDDYLSEVEECKEDVEESSSRAEDDFYDKMEELKNNSAIEEEPEDDGTCDIAERSFALPKFVSLGLEYLNPKKSVEKEVEAMDRVGTSARDADECSLEDSRDQSGMRGDSVLDGEVDEECTRVLHGPIRHNPLSSLKYCETSLDRVSADEESVMQRTRVVSRSALIDKVKCAMSFVNVTDRKCSQDGIVRRQSKRTRAQTAGIYDTIVYRYCAEDKSSVVSHRECRVSPHTVRRRQRLRDIANNIRAPCRKKRRNTSVFRHFAKPDYMDLDKYRWSPDGIKVSFVNPETQIREEAKAVISLREFLDLSENFVEKRRHCLRPRFFSRRLLNDRSETVLEVKSCGATLRTAVVVVDECAIRVTSSQRLLVPRNVWFLVHNAGGSRITVIESVRICD